MIFTYETPELLDFAYGVFAAGVTKEENDENGDSEKQLENGDY